MNHPDHIYKKNKVCVSGTHFFEARGGNRDNTDIIFGECVPPEITNKTGIDRCIGCLDLSF